MKSVLVLFVLLMLNLELLQNGVNGVSENPADENPSEWDKDLVFWALKKKHRIGIFHRTSAYYSNANMEADASNKLEKKTLFESAFNGEIWSISADYHAKRLYYTDYTGNFIGVYDLETQTHMKLFQGMAWGIDSISVDWVSGNVYWADSNYKWIMVANRNFSYYTNIIAIESNIPAKIAVHPEERYIYWTEKGDSDCRIWRSDLQGFNHELLHTFPQVQTISDVTIDFVENRFYWAERLKGSGAVSRIRFFDMYEIFTVHEVYSANSSYIFGLASYKDHLLVTDDLRKLFIKIDKETKEVTNLYHLLSTPRGLTVYSEYEQPISDEDRNHKCSESPCDHICLAMYGVNQYACECSTGSTLKPDGRTCSVSMMEDNFAIMLDGTHSKIFQLNMASPGFPQEVKVSGVSLPTSAVYESVSRRIYWGDEKARRISRATLYGKDQEILVNNSQVYSLALDTGAGNMYWIDSEKDSLFVSNLNGSFKKELLQNNMHRVWAMTIDTKRGFLYWSDWGKIFPNSTQRGVIETARLDGSERRVLLEVGLTPHGLTIDIERNMLFWTQIKDNLIGWYNLETGKKGNFKLPLATKQPFPIGIAYYDDQLYVTDMGSKHVLQISMLDVMSNLTFKESSKRVKKFGPSMFYQLSGISIFEKRTRHLDESACAKANCPQLCLPVHKTGTSAIGFRCECQDGYYYRETDNSCVKMSSVERESVPSFGDTCPSSMIRIFADECSDTAVLNFTEPTAGSAKVKSYLRGTPPFILKQGQYVFMYKATNSHGESANCQFMVEIMVRECFSTALINRPHTSVLSTPSCGKKVGSLINVTCPGSVEPAYQYACRNNMQWEAVGEPKCPDISPYPGAATKKTESTTKSAKGSENSSDAAPNAAPNKQGPLASENNKTTSHLTIALVVTLFVLLAFLVFGIFAYRRNKRGLPWITGPKWSRMQDNVQLATSRSGENGIYIGEHNGTTPGDDTNPTARLVL